jgi:hypothetical protein
MTTRSSCPRIAEDYGVNEATLFRHPYFRLSGHRDDSYTSDGWIMETI